jgi:hypothetical protein
MADHLGLKLGVVQRSRGQSVLNCSAYRRGASARLPNGSIVDYSGREDLVAHFVVAPDRVPDWAQVSEQLWPRAVAAEKRANAQEARTIELSIPRALPKQYWIELARGIALVLAKRGMVVQVDIHCPTASDGLPNPHIHLLVTMREIKDGEFSRTKARHWNKDFYGRATAIRYEMAELFNEFCRRRGVHYHADPRSNAERGLPPSEVRVPRWNVCHFKRTGMKTPAMEQRDKEREIRAEVARLEAECRDVERELEAARAAAMLATAVKIPVAAPPKLVRRPATKRRRSMPAPRRSTRRSRRRLRKISTCLVRDTGRERIEQRASAR